MHSKCFGLLWRRRFDAAYHGSCPRRRETALQRPGKEAQASPQQRNKARSARASERGALSRSRRSCVTSETRCCAALRLLLAQGDARKATRARRHPRPTTISATRACKHATQLGTSMPGDMSGDEQANGCTCTESPCILHTCGRPACSRVHMTHARLNGHSDCRATPRALCS